MELQYREKLRQRRVRKALKKRAANPMPEML